MRIKRYDKNFWLGVINGVLFYWGMGFINPTTVLPSFLSQLTTNKALIGFVSNSEDIGFYLPQIITSRFVQGLKRSLPVYFVATILRVISLFAMAACIFLFDLPQAWLVSTVVFYLLFTFVGGIAGVPFLDVVAKIVAPTQRGSFFGIRNLVSGILVFISGFWVAYILGAYPFPQNNGILFAMAALMISVGVMLFNLIREPENHETLPVNGFGDHWKRIRAIWSGNPDFRNTVYFVWVMGLFAMGLPFYILFAQTRYHLPPSIAGQYLIWQFSGFVGFNFLWSYFSDRKGNRKVLKGVSALALLLPAFALVHSQLGLPVVWFAIVFLLIGGVRSGLIIGAVNYVVEISPNEERPTYLGTIHTLMAIPALSPILGGFIIERFSFELLFIVLTFSALVAIFLAYRLIEPRGRGSGYRV